MKTLLAVAMSLFFMTGLGVATPAAAEVVNKFRADGLTADATFHDQLGCAQGGVVLHKHADGSKYWFNVYLSRLGASYFSGSGYIPATAVSGSVHSGVQIKFNSADLDPGTFITSRGNPLHVDVKIIPDGVRTEKQIGVTIRSDPYYTFHVNGISQNTTARLTGSLNEYFLPDVYNGHGYIGENKGVTVQIEKNNPDN